MQRRSFLFSCAALAGAISVAGPTSALRAIAASQSGRSDAQRIIRLTRNSTIKFPLLSIKEVQTITRQRKGRHIILSLQSAEEYAAGHVPGALLFPPDDLSDPDKLIALVKKLPKNKTVVLICANGHFSCAAMLLLRQLGIDASAMTFGMDGWNRKFAGTGVYNGDINGPISTEPTRLEAGESAPPEFSDLDDKSLIIKSTRGTLLKELSPTHVLEHMDDYMLFCLRRPEDYAVGHIPGSINIPGEAFYSGDKIITQIPRNRKIVLSCYVGHYSSGAALLLTQLGYEAYSLEWGLAGWNNKYLGPVLEAVTQSASLPVESGPGALYMES